MMPNGPGSRWTRRRVLTLGLAPVAVLACAGLRADPLEAGQRMTLHVPRVRGAVLVNAEFEGKKVWEAESGNTRNFENDAGQGMVWPLPPEPSDPHPLKHHVTEKI